MARIKLEGILKHLNYEVKRALAETVRKEMPDAKFDEKDLSNKFIENVGKEIKRWETVPDDLIEKGDY
jgi:hypothetical protein